VRIVDFGRAEGIRYGAQVHPVAVCGQLNPVSQTPLQVLKELRRRPGVPPSHEPRDYQLALSFDGDKRPNITAQPSLCHLWRDILLLGSDEAPILINLNAASMDVAHSGILEGRASRANISQQAEDSSLGYASHAASGPDGAAFYQGRNHRDFLVHAELVHSSSIPERSGMSRGKLKKSQLFLGLLFAPSLLCGKLSHLAPLLWIEQGHAILSASLAALAAHCSHYLRNETHANGDGLGLSYGLQNHAARILNGIKSLIGTVGFSTCAFWHYTFSVAQFGGSRQEGAFSNWPTTVLSVEVLSVVSGSPFG